MFEGLSRYKFILVTGPQRSGTTIAARMIAEDTGKEFIPEAAMATENKNFEARIALTRLLTRLSSEDRSAVVQCPIQCRYIHELDVMYYQASLIVMMVREIPDIIESEKRIGWESKRQKDLYADILPRYVSTSPISVVKYMLWNMVQKPHITYSGGEIMELKYESLQKHKLWIPKEQRIGFGPRQISPTEDYAKIATEVLI